MEWLQELSIFIHFALIIIALISHAIFFKLAVFRPVFDTYSRIYLGLLSFSMLATVVSYALELMICIPTGAIVGEAICKTKPENVVFLSIHKYFEINMLTQQFIFTIDRMFCLCCINFHRSDWFGVTFFSKFVIQQIFSFTYLYTSYIMKMNLGNFWLSVMQFLIAVSLPLELYVRYASKKRYKSSESAANLDRKHQLYITFEIGRSFVYSSIAMIIVEMIIMGGVWLQLAGFLFDKTEMYKLEYFNNALWNANIAIYPWIVMLVHRGLRRRLLKSFANFRRSKKVVPTDDNLESLDGKRFIQQQTMKEHFAQLRELWK